MLRMKNRWLQWLHNVQKPIYGLFLHLVWPKNEENTLPGSFSQNTIVSALQNTHTVKTRGLCLTKLASACNLGHGHICRTVRVANTIFDKYFDRMAHVAKVWH